MNVYEDMVYVYMHESQIQSCIPLFGALSSFPARPLLLCVSAANLPEEIDSAEPNFLKKKNDMRINNLPDVEYARALSA